MFSVTSRKTGSPKLFERRWISITTGTPVFRSAGRSDSSSLPQVGPFFQGRGAQFAQPRPKDENRQHEGEVDGDDAGRRQPQQSDRTARRGDGTEPRKRTLRRGCGRTRDHDDGNVVGGQS